ncbi:MAG: hypothetical protein QXD84_09175 [Thermoplasmata archaeon]
MAEQKKVRKARRPATPAEAVAGESGGAGAQAPRAGAEPAGAPPSVDELEELKREFSEKLFELELERSRLEDIGKELAEGREELERQRAELERQRGELERMRTELSAGLEGRERELAARAEALDQRERELEKKAGLVSAGQEALAALQEELKEKERKLKEAEEETRRLQKDVEDARADLHRREEDIRKAREELHRERAAVEQARAELSRLTEELKKREEELREDEAEVGKRREELAQARKDAEEAGARLRGWEERLRRKEEELRALEAHLLSIEEDLRLCPHCGSVDEFEHLTSRAEELRKRGEDVDEVTAALRAARRALRSGDYAASEEAARRAGELLRAKEEERRRRDAMAKIVAAESLVKMLREARADVSAAEGLLSRARQEYERNQLEQASELAERARLSAQELERERFQALDELAAANSVITALKKTGANVLAAEQKRAEAESAMSSGDFKRARLLASETMVMVSEAVQSQDSSSAMTQIKLAEETVEELRGLGLDVAEWERTLNRSRDFLRKLDFKSAEETARWARSKARESLRAYKQAVSALDHCTSVLSTYADAGILLKRADEIAQEARSRLKLGDAEAALNLSRKAERMAREIAERHRGAVLAIKKAAQMIGAERRKGRDVSRAEKLHDLALHQMELGEYANAMKLAGRAVESLTKGGAGVMELCPTCGEAIPEGIKQCPSCAGRSAERATVQKGAGRTGLATKAQPGKGGRKYACPYCGELFEISSPARPITIVCPWCGYDVSVVE